MRKIYIILFLSFSNFILAQENGLKSEKLMNDEFQEWVNDTLPLIRSQYNILYVEDDNLHIEAKTYYHPCPYYFSKYEYKTIDYNVLLYTDSYWVSYNFYKYIDGAYVYNKKTKETKYLYLEELRGIYDKLK